jgi:diguanylate cyclase (GGDEF)-like protein
MSCHVHVIEEDSGGDSGIHGVLGKVATIVTQSKPESLLRGALKANYSVVVIRANTVKEIRWAVECVKASNLELGRFCRRILICVTQRRTKAFVGECLKHGVATVVSGRDLSDLLPAAVSNAARELAVTIAQHKEIKALEQRLLGFQKLSTTDELTKLDNVRGYRINMSKELKTAARSAGTISLLVFDLDDFKSINSNYGHSFGSFVLSEIGERIKRVKRSTDSAARYGGDEFAIIAPDTNDQGASTLAEKLRSAIVTEPITDGVNTVTVSGSFGCVTARFEKDSKHPDFSFIEQLMFKTADESLYICKANGKNCIQSSSVIV